jgi:hypothetical protein
LLINDVLAEITRGLSADSVAIGTTVGRTSGDLVTPPVRTAQMPHQPAL